MFNFDISRIVFTLPGILLAITVHEFSHAYSAYRLGDPTSKHYGRLTLNPFAHIDIVGFLMLLLAGFGWAKPVPVNPDYFKRRKLGYFIVSIAGPLSNIVLAILLTFTLGFYIRSGGNLIITTILFRSIQINVVLAIFNLFPIPPLDGSKLLFVFLPESFEYYYYRYQKYSYIILLALLVFDIIDIVLFPAVEYVVNILWGMLNVVMGGKYGL